MEEIWRDIPGWEGLYQVTNTGKVKSLTRFRRNGAGGYIQEGRTLKPDKNKQGYYCVVLSNGDYKKRYRIHRIVMETFVPNPDKLPQVNHKDEDKTNNFVWVNPDGTVDLEKSNLEWCTNEKNINWGTHNERMAKSKTNGKTSKPVLQYTLDGELVAEYPSGVEVQRQNGFDRRQISKCCKGKQKTSHGYIWRFK